MKTKGSAFFLAALLQVGAPLNAKELVDLAAACRSGSDAVHSDELRLPAQDGMVRCLDRHAYLPNVSIKAAQLRYSDALDLYMLFLFVDPADKARLGEYSRKHLHERIYLVRRQVVELDATLEAPLVNGYINIAVPGEREGRALMDKLVPPQH